MDYQHILGATDFSELGDLAITRAAELAVAAGARLTVVHVLPEPEIPSPYFAHYEVKHDAGKKRTAIEHAREALAERVPASARESGIEIREEVRVGEPVNELLAVDGQMKPDLIVIATRGQRGWKRFVMGSVAERIVQLAKADVLAVREDPID